MQHFVIDRALVAHLDHRHPLGLEHLLMQALVGRQTLLHVLHWYSSIGSKATELFCLKGAQARGVLLWYPVFLRQFVKARKLVWKSRQDVNHAEE